jgi:hypothetical protein
MRALILSFYKYKPDFMKTDFLELLKKRWSAIVISLLVMLSGIIPASAQQWVVNQKDNTRPETTAYNTAPAFVQTLSANRWNGYNDIEWTVSSLNDTKKFIIEYSLNAVDYLTAGEVLADKNIYSLRHHILDDRPMLYRVRIEQQNGKFFYTAPIVLQGVPVSPVQIYPTVITGNTVNMNASWPVERIVVSSGSGAQVFTKEIGGQSNYIAVVVPSLAKGMYWMSFYGRGWKSTEKFLVP